jgi:hypothetical protein
MTDVATLRQSPPANGTAVTLHNVVVVGHVTSKKYGHVYVQDQGGGNYSGIHLFCNYGGTSPNCAMTQATIDALVVGTIVTVDGSFTTYTPTSPAGAPTTLEIDAPMITPGTTMMAPVAMAVNASSLTKSSFNSSSDPYKGAYVKVTGNFSVSSTTAMEFQQNCTTGGGTTYAGFETSDGTDTLAVALTFYKTVTYCFAGCGFTCGNPITNQTFTQVAGIVEPDSNANGSIYLRISPLTDSDL